MDEVVKPDIPESALEHIVEFSDHWIDKWSIPNPFVPLFYSGLRQWGVALSDFSFRQDAKNVSETALFVSILKFHSTIIVGLDKLTFRTANPDWSMAPELVSLFDTALDLFRGCVNGTVKSQECTIAFHVTPGSDDLWKLTSNLVKSEVVGEADFYGVSKYSRQSSMFMERSLKFDGGIFYRLTRSFESRARFAEIALALHADEVAALSMVGIKDLV